MFLDLLFVECSPILIPLDCLTEGSQFFLGKAVYVLIAFLVVSVFLLSKLIKECKCKEAKESESSNRFLVHFIIFIVCGNLLLVLGLHHPSIAYCDEINAFSPPPSPVELPEQPVTPPEAPPVPQPVVIPQLAQPLISEVIREAMLFNRYQFLNIGGNNDLRRMVDIINAQRLVEEYVEAALVDDGFSPHSILSKYKEIRGLLHSPQGELLSPRTYNSYVTQIREHGTRESVPYRRIMRAIQNYDLLLER